MNEEDTVTVGQDLVKLEAGGTPEKKSEEATEKPKEPASTGSEAEKPKEPESAPSSSAPEKSTSSTKAPQAETSKPTQEVASKSRPTEEAKPALGNREERRVSNVSDSRLMHGWC